MQEILQKQRSKSYFGKAKNRLVFYEKMLAFVEDGVPAQDAIEAIQKRAAENNNPQRYALELWLSEIRSGSTLSQAVSSWLPSQEVMFFNAGEETGDMQNALEEMIKMVRQITDLRSSVVAPLLISMTYVIVLFGIIIGMSIFLVPEFKDMLPPEERPLFTNRFFMFTDFMAQWGLLIVGVLVSLGFLIGTTLGVFRGSIRDRLDDVPPWSLYRRYQAAQFLIMLASMMKSGMPIQKAIQSTMRFSNRFLNAHFNRMLENLNSGLEDAEALNTGLFPKDNADDIQDYSSLSSFDIGIVSIGRRAISETKERLIKVATTIEIFVKLGITAFALSVMGALIFMVLVIYEAASAHGI